METLLIQTNSFTRLVKEKPAQMRASHFISRMYFDLVPSFLLISIFVTAQADIQKRDFRKAFHARTIESKSSWEHPGTVDTIACAVDCVSDIHCLTFSYISPKKICRGYSRDVGHYLDKLKKTTASHSVIFTSFRETDVSQPGSHGNKCEPNGMCIFQGSFCFRGVCQCKLGLYFNPRENVCVRDCVEYGNKFAYYRGPGIKGHNNKKMWNIPLKTCSMMCVQSKDFTCRTIEWKKYKVCYLSRYGFLDVDDDSKGPYLPDWTFGQRQCMK